jgi:hypothetical protein
MNKACGSLAPKIKIKICFDFFINLQSIDNKLAMNQP